jgi:hypothetical protein
LGCVPKCRQTCHNLGHHVSFIAAQTSNSSLIVQTINIYYLTLLQIRLMNFTESKSRCWQS